MAIKRKSLADSIKRDVEQKKSKKEELSDQVIEKLSGEKVEEEK